MLADEGWSRRLTWLRVVFVVVVVIGLAFPDLDQLDGKGWPFRAVTFPLIMAALPLTWRLSGRRFTYSPLADALIVLPFVIDLVANLAGIYDSYARTDDVLHFVNWLLLVAGVTRSVAVSTQLSRPLLVWLGSGFGAFAIVWWEAAEWAVSRYADDLQLTYGDTIGDLVISTTGGVVGALLVAAAQPRAATEPAST